DRAVADYEEAIDLQRQEYRKRLCVKKHWGDVWRNWGVARLRGEKASAADFLALLPPAPKDFTMSCYLEGCLRLWQGDVAGYQRACQTHRDEKESDDDQEQFTDDGRKGSLWTSALSAASESDWPVLVERAGKALKGKETRAGGHSVRGALLYRAGR